MSLTPDFNEEPIDEDKKKITAKVNSIFYSNDFESKFPYVRQEDGGNAKEFLIDLIHSIETCIAHAELDTYKKKMASQTFTNGGAIITPEEAIDVKFLELATLMDYSFREDIAKKEDIQSELSFFQSNYNQIMQGVHELNDKFGQNDSEYNFKDIFNNFYKFHEDFDAYIYLVQKYFGHESTINISMDKSTKPKSRTHSKYSNVSIDDLVSGKSRFNYDYQDDLANINHMFLHDIYYSLLKLRRDSVTYNENRDVLGDDIYKYFNFKKERHNDVDGVLYIESSDPKKHILELEKYIENRLRLENKFEEKDIIKYLREVSSIANEIRAYMKKEVIDAPIGEKESFIKRAISYIKHVRD